MKSIIKLIVILFTSTCYGNEPVSVIETTFNPSFTRDTEYLFGFAKGDQIIFSLEVIKGRGVREVEVSEYNGSSRFSDMKTSKIIDKVIHVSATGIYKFRIRGSLGTKKCRLTVQRIPANPESISFNTSVYWKTLTDTSFYTVKERFLVTTDTAVVNLVDKTEKVHSIGNLNSSKNTFNFVLPANTSSWSYYIGVDQAGQRAFEKATRDLTKNAAPIVARIPGYGPLAALALGRVSYLTELQNGEDIDYYIVQNGEELKFLNNNGFTYLKKGKIINDFSQMSKRSGLFHFCLKNDNAITGVQVIVKVTAITIKEKWDIREVEKYRLSERKEPFLKNNQEKTAKIGVASESND
jgi:hypothetical protein